MISSESIKEIEEDLFEETSVVPSTETAITYKVQIVTYSKTPPEKVLDFYRGLGVTDANDIHNSTENLYRFYCGSYSNYTDAVKHLNNLISNRLKGVLW